MIETMESVQPFSTNMCHCPTCNALTPHFSMRPEQDDKGEFRREDCSVCSTSTKVYILKDGKNLQVSIDSPHKANQ
jgi:hypothetical protein